MIDLPPLIEASADALLQDAYVRATGSDPSAVLLNFSGVNYVSSIGIALVASLLARARRDGRKLLAFGLSDHYREIFEVTRLTDFISVFPDERSAIGTPR